MTRLDGASRAQLSRRRADRSSRAPFVSVDREPAGRAHRMSMRAIVTLLLPVRILAVIGLTVLVAHVVRERGDVGLLVWLQLVVLAMLSWTVWVHASIIVRRIGWVRRLGASRHRPAGLALPTDRVLVATLRSAAPANIGAASRAAAISARSRRGVAGVSWWLLLLSVVGICLLFIAIVARWMASDLQEGGAGPWLITQLGLLAAAVVAIGWTVRCALTSVARPGGRRRRPQVQRFLNWLLRLLTLGRRGHVAPAIAGPGSPLGTPAGAWSTSFVAQIGALALLATGVLGVGVATAAIESDGSGSGDVRRVAADPEDTISSDDGAAPGWDDTDDGGATGGGPLADDTRESDDGASDVSAEGSAGDSGAEVEDTAAESSETARSAIVEQVDAAAVVSTAFEAPATSSPTPTTTPRPPGTVPSSATTSAPPPTTVAATTTTPVLPTAPSSTSPSPPSPPSTINSATTTTPCAPIGGDPDCDRDGVTNKIEIEYGSDYQNPRSRPEHREYDPATCSDRVDNDLDGATDLSDRGCVGG